MKNEKYESPKIEVISIEPDESLMDRPEAGTGADIGSMNVEPRG